MRIIKPGLYAGTREDAKNTAILHEAGIRRILTVDNEALSLVANDDGEGIKTLFVSCLDEVNADLLSYFDNCVEFIEEGLQNSEPILVHCLSGVSRSIAVLLAYLMRTEKRSLDDAQNTLSKICSSEIQPNTGFMDQLQLYQEMGCQVDFTSPLFKQYRLQLLASQIQESGQSSGVLLSQFINEFKSRANSSQKRFKCRKCRKALFDSDSIIEHDAGQGEITFNWHKRDKNMAPNTSLPACTSLFIEPVEWMLPLLEGTIDGKISCAKCNARLGSFNWAGMQCSCAAWITPAFQFHKNRIDEAFIATPVLPGNNQSQNRTVAPTSAMEHKDQSDISS